MSAPLRKLLEKNIAWHWESQQAQRFEKLKTLVSNTPVLKYIITEEVTLSVDTSSEGLGAALCKKDIQWHMVLEPLQKLKRDMLKSKKSF